MHDSSSVRGGQSVGDLHGHIQQLARVVDRRDGCALDELHHQVIRTDVVELADIGMIQRRDGARFPLEALAEILVRNLDGDGAIEAHIARTIYLAHAARADGRDDLVRPQSGSRSQRHGY